MERIDTLQQESLDRPAPSASPELSDKNLYRMLGVCGLATAVALPITLTQLTAVGVGSRVWIAFLAACLVVLTGVVLAMAGKTLLAILSTPTPNPTAQAEAPRQDHTGSTPPTAGSGLAAAA
ncbi:MAG: hypothetical protein AAGI68_06800 [Planctomycetota bacterium]